MLKAFNRFTPMSLLALSLATAGPAAASVVSTTGLAIVAPPSFIGADFIFAQQLPFQLIFDEQQGVVLASALNTDTGVIAAGTKVDSQLFAVNGPSATVDTSATFSGAVLGIIYISGSGNYGPSDFLGAPGTTYNEASCGNCGFEAGDDFLNFAGNTVSFHNGYSSPGDFARVITAAESGGVPEPAAWGLMFAGFAGVGGLLRRRRGQVTLTAA